MNFRSQTETTVEEPSKGIRTQPKDGALTYSDTESLDDTVIRKKIAEANQLIERVKKALDKTKFGKTPNLCGHVQTDVSGNHSSATDIEVTIDRLTMETEKLMTGNKEESEPKRSIKRTIRESIEKKSDHGPNSFKKRELGKEEETTSSRISLNKTFVKDDLSSDEFAEEPVAQSRSAVTSELNARKKSAEPIEESRNTCTDNFNMRPMTRRNETEDDLPEKRVLDKFRNSPEEGQIVVNSSLEELQAKLQTISESTESSLSTPRNRKFGDSGLIIAPKEVQPSSGCNTDTVKRETQAAQTESEKSSVGIMSLAQSAHKTSQVSKHDFLTPYHMDVQVLTSEPKPLLVETHLKTQEILPKPESSKQCQIDILPIIEAGPFQEDKNSQKKLIEEHLPGVSIPSTRNKLQKLSVQILPPISIDQNMITKEVLNFFISPQGETINFLKETENVSFFAMKANKSENAGPIAVSFCENVEEAEVPEEVVIPEKTREEQSNISLRACTSSRIEAGRNPDFFRKLRDDTVKNIVVVEAVDAAKANNIDPTFNEEMQKKALIYKSYNLMDNRNRHDPGSLDAKSVERISGIDTNVYKTFINPTGMVSEMKMSYRPKAEGIAGFESKEVQCDEFPLESEHKTNADGFPESSKSSSKELNFVIPDSILLVEKRKGKDQSFLDTTDEAGQSQVTVVALQEFESVDLITGPQTPQSELPKSLIHSSIESIVEMEVIVSEARLQSARCSQLKPEPDQPTSELSEKISVLSQRQGMSELRQQMADVPQARPEPHMETRLESHKSKDTPAQHTYPEPVQRKLDVAEAMPRPRVEDYFSTPSEITITISYSLSSEGSTNSRDIKTDVNQLPSKSASAGLEPKEKDEEPKVITLKDKNIINKLKDKLQTISVDSSDPKLIIKEKMSNETTNFIKGIIRMSTPGTTLDENGDETSRTSEDVQNVNYHMIEAYLDSNVNLYPEHLIVAKNGRYKDEENLFAQNQYPKLTSLQRKKFRPSPTHKTEDKEIQNDILGAYPKQMVNRYSPESTNSTSNSLSEGEIPCQHAVSNGEIHVCSHRNQVNHRSRVILPQSNLTSFSLNPGHNAPSQRQILARSNLTNASLNPIHTPNQRHVLNHNITRLSNSPNLNVGPRKFDLLDPTLTIEKRRNYFNNWVTYYVKSQDILDSSTSSCSHNK